MAENTGRPTHLASILRMRQDDPARAISHLACIERDAHDIADDDAYNAAFTQTLPIVTGLLELCTSGNEPFVVIEKGVVRATKLRDPVITPYEGLLKDNPLTIGAETATFGLYNYRRFTRGGIELSATDFVSAYTNPTEADNALFELMHSGEDQPLYFAGSDAVRAVHKRVGVNVEVYLDTMLRATAS